MHDLAGFGAGAAGERRPAQNAPHRRSGDPAACEHLLAECLAGEFGVAGGAPHDLRNDRGAVRARVVGRDRTAGDGAGRLDSAAREP
ncbi:hypothetical protein PT2222_20030 [Paraburkholderia tropica]